MGRIISGEVAVARCLASSAAHMPWQGSGLTDSGLRGGACHGPPPRIFSKEKWDAIYTRGCELDEAAIGRR